MSVSFLCVKDCSLITLDMYRERKVSSTGTSNFGSYASVVITGGSSGIGLALLKAILQLNISRTVINLSRSHPPDISESARFHHVSCDLSIPKEIESAVKEVLKFHREAIAEGPLLLINNSGFGSSGNFPSPDVYNQLEMIGVNVSAPVHLTAKLLPLLQERGGAVMNIASVAGFQPTPYLTTYGATKAFLLHWSLALQQELKDSGVNVLCVCPGPTKTNFFQRAGFEKASGGLGQTAEAVALESLHALRKGRSLVVTGWVNKILVALSAPLPKRLQVRLAERALRQTRKQTEA